MPVGATAITCKQSDLYHGLLTKLMPKRRTEIYQLIDLAKIHHENVSWSNVIINSPISYNLLERRAMYFLSAEVKHKFVEKGLGVPDNWKELYFYLKDNDLGIIGGRRMFLVHTKCFVVSVKSSSRLSRPRLTAGLWRVRPIGWMRFSTIRMKTITLSESHLK